MNRHAYLILAHTNPDQIRTLLGMLDDERNDIFVHIDAGASFGNERLQGCCSKSRLEFTDKRISVHWGGVSIMHAELELLRKATQCGHYAFYHLLSGMDLPIKNQDTIHDFFDANPGKEFIHFWKMPAHTLRRVRYYTLFPEGARSFYTNIPNNIFKVIMEKAGTSINKDVDFRFASQWFSITDKLARYTVNQEQWLCKVFRHTVMIDEIFMATLVWNSPFRAALYDGHEYAEGSTLECNANMRFIDWTRGSSIRHPWTFTIDDLPLLEKVPHFWARKFNEKVDSEIISAIAQKFS